MDEKETSNGHTPNQEEWDQVIEMVRERELLYLKHQAKATEIELAVAELRKKYNVQPGMLLQRKPTGQILWVDPPAPEARPPG